MSSICQKLLDPAVRPDVVVDASAIVDAAVARSKGLSGMAVKGAFKSIKMIKPKFVEGVIEDLLEEWIEKISLFEDEFEGETQAFPAYLVDEKSRVAEALVEITDQRAETTKLKTVAKLYRRLRPSALSYVEGAVPDLAELIGKYALSA